MAITDAALRLLLTDYRVARQARDAAQTNLDAAERALIRGLGAGGETIVKLPGGGAWIIRASADATRVTVEAVRVVEPA